MNTDTHVRKQTHAGTQQGESGELGAFSELKCAKQNRQEQRIREDGGRWF